MKFSAFTSVPSVNFHPFFSLIVYSVLSPFASMESATSFLGFPLASKPISSENSRVSGLPPHTSFVSVGINGFWGSHPYTRMILSSDPPADELPHAANGRTNAPQATMTVNVFHRAFMMHPPLSFVYRTAFRYKARLHRRIHYGRPNGNADVMQVNNALSITRQEKTM